MTSASTQPTDIIHRSPTAGAWAVPDALSFGMAFWVLLAYIHNFGQDVSVPSENALVRSFQRYVQAQSENEIISYVHVNLDDEPPALL